MVLASGMPSWGPSQASSLPPLPQMEKDVRSDVEELDSSDGEAAEECPQMKNGAAQRSGAAPTDGPRSRAASHMANGHTPDT